MIALNINRNNENTSKKKRGDLAILVHNCI